MDYLKDSTITTKPHISPQNSLDVPSPRVPSSPTGEGGTRSPKRYGEPSSGEVSPSRQRTKDLTCK